MEICRASIFSTEHSVSNLPLDGVVCSKEIRCFEGVGWNRGVIGCKTDDFINSKIKNMNGRMGPFLWFPGVYGSPKGSLTFMDGIIVFMYGWTCAILQRWGHLKGLYSAEPP